MPSNYTGLIVTWFDATDAYATTANITDDVQNLPLFTDTGTGEVNEAEIMIKAPFGKYITSTAPVPIDFFDRIRIQVTDLAGKSYDRFFEVVSRIPSQDKGAGTQLQLNCLGTEYHTQRIHFSLPFWFKSPFLPAKVAGDTYNSNKGTLQPLLSDHTVVYDPNTLKGNDLPQFLQDTFQYTTPVSIYSIWMDQIDRMGAALAGGGVFDFFELAFDTPSVNAIDFRIFSSGAGPENKTPTPGVPVTITKTLSVNPSESEGILENQSGTVTHLIGDAKSGSLTEGREIYNSGIFQFTFRPLYLATINYGKDAKIKFENQHYISKVVNNLNHTPPVTAGVADEDAFWKQIDMGDEFGDAQEYSEWTADNAALIVNSGANPTSVNEVSGDFTSVNAVMFDGNRIINDNGFFRTAVMERAEGDGTTVTKQLNAAYLYPNGLFGRGQTFLCIDEGPFTPAGTKDRNGIEFKNSVVERVKTNQSLNLVENEWVVKYKFDSTLDKMQIAVDDEGKVFQWNNATTDFTDITTQDLGSDCYHKWKTLKNVEGFDPKPNETNATKFPDVTKAGGKFTKNLKSAIEIVYDFNTAFVDRVTDRVAYQSHGAWFNIKFPFPINTYNSISEGVGDIFGGGTTSIATGLNEPATLDIANMGFTPKGNIGYNKEDSTRLQPLTTFSFAIGLKIEGRNPIGGSLFTLDGTANIRVLMGDTDDNVWYFDFELPETNGNFWPIDTQLSAYQVYRGHKPRYADLNNIIDLINPKDIDKQNIFESRNIKWITIQHQDQYDEFGRFAPEGNLNDLSNTSLSSAFGGQITITIDDLHFKKALFVSSGADATRNLEQQFVQRHDILLYDQGTQIADSQQEIEKFPLKQFDITRTGTNIFDIRFGDTFFFENDRLVVEADNGPNTIELISKRNEYSISRPTAGSGGLQHRVRGIKRLIT